MLRLPEVKPIGDGCQSILLIRIRTDEGITGIGEVHTNPTVTKAIIDAPLCSVASRGLREILIGENPLDIGRLWDKMYHATAIYGRRGAVMHAISGIDIALWDILGKAMGQPIHRLLGGARAERFPIYASDLMPDTTEATAEMGQRHRAAGYRAMKLGWGSLGPPSRRRCQTSFGGAGRRAATRWTSWSISAAPSPSMRRCILGGPLPISASISWRSRSPPTISTASAAWWRPPRRPIATGEKETTQFAYLDLMERGGLRIIQPDVARVGGISEALRIAALAEARNVQVIPHCWATDILVAATLQVISTLRACPYLEYNVTDNPLRRDLLVHPIRPVEGIVTVPTGPGLGIELNEDTVARYRWRHETRKRSAASKPCICASAGSSRRPTAPRRCCWSG